MTTKVKKWGNSLAIRLPKDIVAKYGLKENSELDFVETKETFGFECKKMTKTLTKDDWKKFVVTINKPRENISENIDKIIYGA